MKNKNLYIRILLVAAFLLQTVFASALGKRESKTVQVGETFTVHSSGHSRLQSVLWHWDTNTLELVGNLYGTSTSATFKAKRPTPASGVVIQATVYYYASVGSTITGKFFDDWTIHVEDNTNVNLDTSNRTMDVGDSFILRAVTNPSDYTGSYSWTTSDYSVASISGYGDNVSILARSAGRATIRVTLDNGKYAECYVTVSDNSTVSLSTTRLDLSTGDTFTLNAIASTYSYGGTYSWSSSNSSVASCTSYGSSANVYAKSAGRATITVTLSNGAKAECSVNVEDVDVRSASISDISLEVEKSMTLGVDVSPTNATVKSREWTVSEGNEVVSISGSTLKGLKPGKAKIYCTLNGSVKSNTAMVTITEPALMASTFQPQNNAVDVSPFTSLRVTYSHTVTKGSDFGNIRLSGGGATVAGSVEISERELRFTPDHVLKPQTQYRLTIPRKAVVNKWGSAAESDVSVAFTTSDYDKVELTMMPASGTFLTMSDVVTIKSNPEDATIYYTLDGTTPTDHSTVYGSSIKLDKDAVVRAIAVREGYYPSDVVSGEYFKSQSEIVDYYPSDEKPLFNYGPAVPHLKLSGEVVKSNNFRRIALTDSHGVDVDGEAYLTKYMISFVPDESLVNGEEYTLTIPYNAVKTANGEVFKGYSWTFKTPVMPVKVAMQGDETVLVHSENGTLRSRGKEYLSITPADGSFTFKDLEELSAVQKNIVDFSAGYTHRSVVDNNTAEGSGLAYCGETASFPELNNIKLMKAGFQTTAVIDKNNTLWMCGRNDFGQLADSTGTTSKSFVKSADNIIDVAPGNGYTLYVDTDHVLWGVGRNHLGQLGDGTTVDRAVPVKIHEGVAKVFASTSGWFCACLTTDNQLLTWGDNSSSQLGREAGKYSAAPGAVALADVEKVSLGGAHALAVTSDGRLFSWGSNVSGQIAESGSVLKTPTLMAEGVKMAAAGPNTSLVMAYSGKILGYGRKAHSNFGSGEGKVYGFVVDPGIACHPLHGVKIEPYKFEVAPGDEFAFVARPEPYSAEYESVEWVSDHPEIAEVVGNGVVRAGNLGEATVTVRLTDRHGAVKEAKAKVVSTDTPDNSEISKVSTLHASEWSAFSDGNLIIIKNAAAGCVYTVYNVQGITVGQAVADGDELIFEVGQPGVYIISSGMKTVKILCG